jgi:hypothetical protein
VNGTEASIVLASIERLRAEVEKYRDRPVLIQVGGASGSDNDPFYSIPASMFPWYGQGCPIGNWIGPHMIVNGSGCIMTRVEVNPDVGGMVIELRSPTTGEIWQRRFFIK